MAFPLVGIYYGLLIIASILFFRAVEEGYTLDDVRPVLETISVRARGFKEMVSPYIDDCAETFKDHIKHLGHPIEEAPIVQAEPCATLKFFENIVQQPAIAWALRHVEDVYAVVVRFAHENPWIKVSISRAETFTLGVAESVYGFLSTWGNWIVDQEPIKSWASEYALLHGKYVTPYVEQTSHAVSTKIMAMYEFLQEYYEEAIGSESTRAFLVIVIGFVVSKYMITVFLRAFVNDAFQMNRSMSDMYKQHRLEELRETTHNEVYLEIKESALSGYHMTVDELEEVEEPEVSRASTESGNSTPTVAVSGETSPTTPTGSNRTPATPGSNRRTPLELQQEETKEEEQQEEEQQEEVIQEIIRQEAGQGVTQTPSIPSQLKSKTSSPSPSPSSPSPSSPSSPSPSSPSPSPAPSMRSTIPDTFVPPSLHLNSPTATTSTTETTVAGSNPDTSHSNSSVRSLLVNK